MFCIRLFPGKPGTSLYRKWNNSHHGLQLLLETAAKETNAARALLIHSRVPGADSNTFGSRITGNKHNRSAYFRDIKTQNSHLALHGVVESQTVNMELEPGTAVWFLFS